MEHALDDEFEAAFNEVFEQEFGHSSEHTSMIAEFLAKDNNCNFDPVAFTSRVHKKFLSSLSNTDRIEFEESFSKLLKDVSEKHNLNVPPDFLGRAL